MKGNRQLIRKIFSVVLALAVTVGTVNLQPFVSNVKAATTTIKFVGNSEIANDNARMFVVDGEVSSTSAYRNSDNEMTAGVEMTRSATEDYTWTAEVSSDVVTFIRVSPASTGNYYWNEWYNTERGDNTTFTTSDVVNGTGEWTGGTDKEVEFTIKLRMSDDKVSGFMGGAKVYLCKNTEHGEQFKNNSDAEEYHTYNDTSAYEFEVDSEDSTIWRVKIPTSFAKSGNLKIERLAYSETATQGMIWGLWDLSDKTNVADETYYITDYLDKNQTGTSCAGQWIDPQITQNIIGTQRTDADYGYDFSSVDLSGMTDTNTKSQNTLFTVPAVMYSYKSGGGSSWWDQFQNFNNAMKAIYWGTDLITHPLVTGAPDSRSTIINNDINLAGSRPLYQLLSEAQSYSIDDRLWYTNHNLSGNGSGGADTSTGYAVGTSLQGLVAPYLSTNNELLSSENNVVMPFFDDDFLTDYADKYGSLDNPIQFPFRVTADGHYIFDSKSGKDNVYMNEEGNLVYNSSSSATITNPSENASGEVGFFPFNTPIPDNVNANATLASSTPGKEDTAIKYGFGMRLEIPFTVSGQTETSEDMVFKFSGDDDLWVYVDGKLALDVGGAHGRANGSINFTTGEVTVDSPCRVTDTGIEAASATSTQDWIKNLSKSKTHTLSVFYMERGLYDSNLMIDFNLAVVDLTQKNGLTVTNTMDLSNIQASLQNTVSGIMEKDKFSYTASDLTDTTKTLFETNSFSFGGNGKVNQSEEVDGSTEEGIRNDRVSIKQNEDERFDTSYSVGDGTGEKFVENVSGLEASDKRTDGENSVTIQNKTPVEAGEDVGVEIDYLNVAKSTGFSIAKNFEGTDSESSYTFEVKYTQLFGADNETYGLSGSLAGVSYTVYDSDTNAKIEDKTVSADSTIEISAGQKAVFTGIPVNTKIKVTELNATKTFKNVKVSGSDESAENATFTTNEGTMATLAYTNEPEFVFTNTEPDMKRLVYYTEIGKTTDLPLPADLTHKTTKEGQSETTTTVSHEKTSSITMNGADNADITVSTTISDVQATINGSNEHKLKITSPAQGGYGIKAITINNNTYDYNAIKNQYLTGTCGTLSEGWLIDVNGTITIPFTMTSDGDVNVSINYRGWSVSYVWPVVLDEGVTTTVTTPGTESVTYNDYTLENASSDITFTHNADSSNKAEVTWENGDVSNESSVNKMTFTSKHVGYDKFVLKLADNANNGTQKVEVVVYNYNVNDKVYVLDYGLKTDLFADTNGILGGTTPYNYDKNFSVTNKSILQDDTDADGYTVLGMSDSTVGSNYKNSLNYTYSDGEFKNQMDFSQATALWADSKLMYTPKKFMSDVDTFYMGVQVTKDGVASGASDLDASNATPVMTSKVEVMPANIVYYEDNFSNSGTDENIDSKSGIIYSGDVTIDGESKDSSQSNALDMQYGYDPAYEDESYGNSNGSSHELGKSAMAAFEFRGTGFDIVSRTNRSTGVIVVSVYNKTDDTKITKNNGMLIVQNGWSNLVKSMIIDTSYENGDLYQVPVITWRNETGEAGDYIVTITSLKGNNSEAKSVFIDGIRIYNPAKGNSTAEGKYDDNNELDATVSEIKQLILGTNFKFDYDNPLDSTSDEQGVISLAKYTGNGAAFLTGKSVVESFNGYNTDNAKESDPNTTKDMMTYAVSGPNNELYLSAGYGLAFMYDDIDGYTGNSKTIQIGIKNVKGSELTLQYLKEVNNSAVWTDIATIKSATELYYKLDTLEDKYDGMLYLRVAGGDGYVSLTGMKVAGYELSPATATTVEDKGVKSELNPTDVVIKAGYNTKSDSFIKDRYAMVKVTTPVTVDDIKVFDANGKEVTLTTASSKTVDGGLEWTLKFKASKTENIKASTMYIVGYDEEGYRSEKFGFDGKVVQE